MSFLTLEKFLHVEETSETVSPASVLADGGEAASGQDQGYFELAHKLMVSVERSVLVGEATVDLATELRKLREDLHQHATAEELNRAVARFDTSLQTFRNRLYRADQERAEGFRNVLGILNEAFGYVSSGSERSGSRLKHLESSLQRAVRCEDLHALKTQLSDTLVYIRQQSELDAKANSGALLSLNRHILLAQRTANRFGSSLSERSEAVKDLAEASTAIPGGTPYYVAAFTADVANSLRSRHGSEVGDTLLEEVAQRALRPAIAESKIYRWTDSSLVAIWQTETPPHVVNSMITGTCKELFEYRAFVGTRVASFSVPLRSKVLPVEGSSAALIEVLDRFAGV